MFCHRNSKISDIIFRCIDFLPKALWSQLIIYSFFFWNDILNGVKFQLQIGCFRSTTLKNYGPRFILIFFCKKSHSKPKLPLFFLFIASIHKIINSRGTLFFIFLKMLKWNLNSFFFFLILKSKTIWMEFVVFFFSGIPVPNQHSNPFFYLCAEILL